MTLQLTEMPGFDQINEILTTRAIREAFKYTSTKKLLATFAKSSRTKPATVSGHKDLELLTTSIAGTPEPDQRFPFVSISQYLTGQQTRIVVPEGHRSMSALQVHHAGLSNTWIDLQMGENAELSLIETDSAAGCSTSNINITLAPGARLYHHRCLFGTDSNEYHATHIQVQKNAHYQFNHYAGGTLLRRVDHLVQLCGEGASANLVGACALAENTHLDQNFCVEHIAGHCNSGHVLNGISQNKAKFSFNGRIHIHPQAQKSAAHLTNKNLMLGPTAEVNTKPELEIYADDVICSHGATVGQLDETAIFYLRSRGLPESQAKNQLARAFLFSRVSGELGKLAQDHFARLLTTPEVIS